MADFIDRIKTKEDFDSCWKENYVPVVYEDVKDVYETFVKEMEKKIFIQDYEEKNCISRTDFIENLHQDAQFTFQDALTEAFYDKNPELYETAFALFEAAEMEGRKDSIAVTFHENFNSLYTEFLNIIYDTFYEASEEQ